MLQNQPSALLVGVEPYVIRACLRSGIKPFVVYGPDLKDWGYVELAGDVETIFAEDLTSVESVLSSLKRAGIAQREFICIQTSEEEALVAVAAIARVLGIPTAVDTDIALHFRDKWLQKQIVAAAGVEVAMSRVIEDVCNPDLAGLDDFDKAVLKPIAGAGTRNTSIVRGREELVAKCAEYRRRGTPQRTFVLEEFIAGDEWTVDGVVFNGEIQFLSVGNYAEPCLSAVNSNTALQLERFDPVADAEIHDLVRPVAGAALRALGLDCGVFHMEVFYQQETGKLIFGECAARTGGAGISEVLEYKFGVDLGQASLHCAAGIDPEINPSVRPEHVGTIFLATRPGILIGYPAPAEIQALPGVEYVRLDRPYGFHMADSVADATVKVGQVMLSGSTRDEYCSRRDFLTQWFDERLVVVPAEATNRDLRRWQKDNWPESASTFSTYSNDGSVS